VFLRGFSWREGWMLDGCLEEQHATMLKDLSPMVTGLLKMPNMIKPHLRYFSPAATDN